MPITRSENTARIRSQDTSPERVLHDALVEAGIPVERHPKTAHGRPDLVIADRQIAIPIDDGFWHGNDTCPHGCVYCYAVQTQSLAADRYQRHDPEGEFLFPVPGVPVGPGESSAPAATPPGQLSLFGSSTGRPRS